MIQLSEKDFQQLAQKGIAPEQIKEQLAHFEQGFPYLELVASASAKKGIKRLDEKEQKQYLQCWNDYLEHDKKIVKFVPASGAASRMFKDLFAFLSAEYDAPQTVFEKTFFEQLERFAFYIRLNESCVKNEGRSISDLLTAGQYKPIVENLLYEKGLNYGQLPKGLLLFHNYREGARTAMEEHLVEGALYARNRSRQVNVHFTVSPDHKELFQSLVAEKAPFYADRLEVHRYDVSFSEQKGSTDTLAVDRNNCPFRDKDQLLFRPGGHGALIENLNEIDADVVFIKNIDNVVPDSFKEVTVRYKQLLAGILVDQQMRIFRYLELIDTGNYNHDDVMEMLYFLQDELCIKNPETKNLEDVELVLYIKSKLNRPLRVCGMVKNVGEPGGGPFRVIDPDGTIALQILESSQIDMSDAKSKELFESGTHFNPVDLVCALKDYQGNKFNLPDYIDKKTGFISYKSKDGRELKALELPGLWNGAMSDWNTLFVEVPIETFNPVKTVNDLLRREHQPLSE